LYDPTNPVLRPKLVQCKARHKVISHNLRFIHCDFVDSTDNIVSIKFLMHGTCFQDSRTNDLWYE